MNESQRPCQQTHHHERYVIIYVIIHITIHVNWLFNPWWNLWCLFSSQTLGLGWATRAQCQSMTFFELSNNGKQASQISDTVMIVTKFVTKKYIFVAVYILWPTIDDECIFIPWASQNAKHNENNHFCDINRMSPKVKSLVVVVDCRQGLTEIGTPWCKEHKALDRFGQPRA